MNRWRSIWGLKLGGEERRLEIGIFDCLALCGAETRASRVDVNEPADPPDNHPNKNLKTNQFNKRLI